MKKFAAIVMAIALTLALAVSAFADYDAPATLGIQVGDMNNGGWGYSEVVEVTAPGTYTLTYDGEERALSWIVIKSTDDNRDGTAVINTVIPAGTVIRITALEIDGTAYTFDSGDSYDTVVGDNGTVEIQPYNSFTGNDHITDRPESASKVVVTFVVDPDAAAAAPETAETESEPEAAPEAAPETAPEAAPETAPEAAPETAPEAAPEAAPETAPVAPATGIALAVVPAVVALAAVAISKKH